MCHLQIMFWPRQNNSSVACHFGHRSSFSSSFPRSVSSLIALIEMSMPFFLLKQFGIVSSFKYAHKIIIGLKMSLKRCGDGLMAMHVMWVMRIFTSIPLSQSLSLSLISDLFIYLPHFCSHCLDNNNPKIVSYRMFWQCCSGISLRGATALRWWNWALIGLIGFAAHSNSHYWDWLLGEIGPESMTKQKKAWV